MNLTFLKTLQIHPGAVNLAEGRSGIGRYVLAAGEAGIFHLEFGETLREKALRLLMAESKGRITDKNFPYPEALTWLKDFFQVAVSSFLTPIDLGSGTPFQRKVWEEVSRVPRGRVTTYSNLARLTGSPSPRAVGTANGRNPLPFIIPCHRVVRKDGSMGGYGLGIPLKIRLLGLEGVPMTKTSEGMKVSSDFLAKALKDD